MKDTFDAVPISVDTVVESEPVPVSGHLRPEPTIDEKHRPVDTMLLEEFSERYRGNCGSNRVLSDMVQAIRVRINRGLQPELIAVELDHGFVDSGGIRVSPITRL